MWKMKILYIPSNLLKILSIFINGKFATIPFRKFREKPILMVQASEKQTCYLVEDYFGIKEIGDCASQYIDKKTRSMPVYSESALLNTVAFCMLECKKRRLKCSSATHTNTKPLVLRFSPPIVKSIVFVVVRCEHLLDHSSSGHLFSFSLSHQPHRRAWTNKQKRFHAHFHGSIVWPSMSKEHHFFNNIAPESPQKGSCTKKGASNELSNLSIPIMVTYSGSTCVFRVSERVTCVRPYRAFFLYQM